MFELLFKINLIYSATSGDTGSSAVEAIRGQKWVDIVMLFPRGRISQIQKLQMTSVIDDNVHVFRGRLWVSMYINKLRVRERFM